MPLGLCLALFGVLLLAASALVARIDRTFLYLCEGLMFAGGVACLVGVELLYTIH